MEKKRKMTLDERMEADPELKAAMEESEDLLVERIKQGYRERHAREARQEELRDRQQRRRERLRRFSFGLLGGG
jgi:hypothetical protein